MEVLLEIDELVRESPIDLLKDRLESERDRGGVAVCLGGALLSYKKVLNESDISCGRNNCPRRVFSIWGDSRM